MKATIPIYRININCDSSLYVFCRTRTNGYLHKFNISGLWNSKFWCDNSGRAYFWGLWHCLLLFLFLPSVFLAYSFFFLVGLCLCMESGWFTSCIGVCLIGLVFILCVWVLIVGSFKGYFFYLLDSHIWKCVFLNKDFLSSTMFIMHDLCSEP